LQLKVNILQDDEIPSDEKFDLDGKYVPKILFLGILNQLFKIGVDYLKWTKL
jgi:hypothetical protein